MATGTQPDAGQILNSLINSILLIDDNLAIHYANPAAQQLLAQSSQMCIRDSPSAVIQARQRLGSEAVRRVFTKTAQL